MHTTVTITERIRRQDAPTQPPRFAVFALVEGEDAACYARQDDPELALDLAAQKLAEAAERLAARARGAYQCTKVAVVERDGERASLYEQRVLVQNDGSTVMPPAVYLREAKWCCACEAEGHTVRECVDEDGKDAPETEAEALGLGLGAR